jgi:putative intracellular protease/amidase
MKKVCIALLVIIISVVCGTLAMGQSSPQVLMIPREGYSHDIDLMLSKEVGVMTSLLEKAGFKVVVATVAGEAIKGSSTTLMPNLKLAEVKVADYAGFILPCMAVGGFPGPPVAPVAVKIVKQALNNGKPVAAQFGSVYTLAEAGVLVGKRYAFPADALTESPPGNYKDARFAGAIYGGKGVVKDGNIITSGYCPYLAAEYHEKDCTTELTQTFIAALGQKK